jgi:hypothetical protein
MVAVHVGDKNFCCLLEAYSSLYHLPLGALAAVKQQQLILSFDGNC